MPYRSGALGTLWSSGGRTYVQLGVAPWIGAGQVHLLLEPPPGWRGMADFDLAWGLLGDFWGWSLDVIN